MKPESFLDGRVTMLCGDVRAMLATLPDNHFDCVVTSPPYWGLRDYGTARWEGGDPNCDHRSPTMREGRDEDRAKLKGSAATNSHQNILAHHTGCGKCGAVKIDDQIGLESTLGEHLAVMVDVFRDVRRVLKPSGTCWINYGDCYATSPNGRSAAATKDAGGDDRTFRDKPFSTIGAIYDPDGGQVPDSKNKKARTGKTDNKGNKESDHGGRIRAVSGGYLKAKDLCMVPNRLAIALQDDGWWVRSEIIWHKPNPMPESTRDRPTSSHEKIWLLTKSERYFYDADAIAEPVTGSTLDRISQPNWENQSGSERANGGAKTNGNMKAVVKRSGNKERKFRVDHGGNADLKNAHQGFGVPWEGTTRNCRNVWTMGTQPFSEAHFATFPPELAERCIKAGSPAGGDVLDIFGGAGTTALVAATLGRRATLIELNPEYCTLARARIEAAFMGRAEGAMHMTKSLGRVSDAGPLFGGADTFNP